MRTFGECNNSNTIDLLGLPFFFNVLEDVGSTAHRWLRPPPEAHLEQPASVLSPHLAGIVCQQCILICALAADLFGAVAVPLQRCVRC